MRRVTKKFLILIFGVLLTVIYCEYFIYYVVALQCSWPVIKQHHSEEHLLKAFILSDIHLLGPRKGHWVDKWRREWQMHQAYQAIMRLHDPDVVFVLGDLFDEGEVSDDEQFKDYVEQFHKLFPVPRDTLMHVVAGNHDMAVHNYMKKGTVERFSNLLNTSLVEFITLKNNYFVLINSMAMKGDSCNFCTKARKDIQDISGILKCLENQEFCFDGINTLKYSRPILMQHFPLYRKSDAVCSEPDTSLPELSKPFRVNHDVLSKESTEYHVTNIKPRAVFGGHTHHSCLLHHAYQVPEAFEFYEYSVPSFSWRYRSDPKYMLVTITPSDYSAYTCELPKEATITITAFTSLSIVVWLTTRGTVLGGRGTK